MLYVLYTGIVILIFAVPIVLALPGRERGRDRPGRDGTRLPGGQDRLRGRG
jgi:hypothetical protein